MDDIVLYMNVYEWIWIFKFIVMKLFLFKEIEGIVFIYDKWINSYNFCWLYYNLDKIVVGL